MRKLGNKWKTLRWINQIRKIEGKRRLWKMPKGEIGSYTKCPIATALGGYVSIHGAILDGGIYPLPLYARNFVLEFDSGRYPDLRALAT